MDNNLLNYLKENDIEYKVHRHKAFFTVKESKELKKDIPGVHTKSLFLKDEKGNFYLICLIAEKRLNINKLKKELNVRKLEFGNIEELKKELNITPGSVSISCMIYAKNTKLIVDSEVWGAEVSVFHPNDNTASLEISHKNLNRFYDSLICEKSVIKIE